MARNEDFDPNGSFWLQFPENDEETNSVYEATVTFRPIEVEGEDIASFIPSAARVKEALAEKAGDAWDGFTDTVGAGVDASVDFVQSLPGRAQNLFGRGGEDPDANDPREETDAVEPVVPPNLDADPNLETDTEVQTIVRRHADPVPQNDRYVSLFLPQAFQLNEGVEYENVNIGAIGVQVQQGLNSPGGVMNALAKAATNTGGLIDGLKSNAGGEVAKLLGTRMAQAASTEIGAAVATSTRLATNPNTRSLFKNVNLRTFNFSFTLVPNSPKEAKTIENIVAFFRTELYPEEIGFQGIPMGYRFPNMIEIRLQNRGSNVITRILPAYLMDVQVVYNSQSMSMHRGPNPNAEFTDVQLTLNFREYRPLNKQDILYEYGFEGEHMNAGTRHQQSQAWLNRRPNAIRQDILDNN